MERARGLTEDFSGSLEDRLQPPINCKPKKGSESGNVGIRAWLLQAVTSWLECHQTSGWARWRPAIGPSPLI